MKNVVLFLGVLGLGMVTLWSLSATVGKHPDDASLLRVVEANGQALAAVAEALIAAGPEARVDVRSGAPPVASGWTDAARALRDAGVDLAEREPLGNGIAFRVTSAGIGISGATSGLLYRAPNAAEFVAVEPVASLEQGFTAAKRGQPRHREVSALFVRQVAAPWWLYLDAR